MTTVEDHVDPGSTTRPKVRQSKGRRRAASRSGGTMEARNDVFAHVAEKSFLVRESGEYDLELIAKMIDQVLEPWSHISAVQTALSLGVTPLMRTPEGHKARQQLNARTLYASGHSRKSFGVRFVIDGIVFQYGLTSGAATGVKGDNDWVNSVADLVDEWRPAEVITGPMSRLARLGPLFNELEAALARSRAIVRVAETPEGMDVTTHSGKTTWDALVRAVVNDYVATINRLITGVVFDLKRGRYPRSAVSLPPGYVKQGGKGPERNRVRPSDDPLVIGQVRHFIELCASRASDSEIAQEMGLLGWTTRNQQVRSLHGDLGIHHLGDPKKAVTILYEHLTLYATGVHYFQHEMPLPNIDVFHGLPIHRFGPNDNGYFQVDLDFGLPEGGWHDDDVIKRAIANRLTEKDPRPTYEGRTKIKPLAGLIRYIDDGWEYCLMANEHRSYELKRRQTTEDNTPARRGFDDLEGEPVGRFSASGLHRALATALRQLTTGTSSSLPCPATPATPAGLIEELERDRANVLEQAERARREVLRHHGDESEAYRQLAHDLQCEAVALSGKIAAAQSAVRPAPGATLDGEKVAALIKILEDLDGPADMSVHHAVRSLVRSATFTRVAPGDPLAELLITIDLRTNAGSISAGPLRSFVRNHAAGGKSGSQLQKKMLGARNTQMVKMLLLEGVDEEERRAIWEQERFTGRTYTRRMLDTLIPFIGGPVASAIVDCPILDVRRAALRPYLDHDLPVSDEFGPELEALVTSTYARVGFSWPKSWCPGGMARERQVLGFLAAYSSDLDAGMPLQTIMSALQIKDHTLYRMRYEGAARYGHTEPAAAPWYARIEIHKATDESGRLVPYARLRQCPHCGERSLTQPLRVPEVPGYLLCSNATCRKSLLSTIRFTDEFFLPWDGSQSYVRRVEGSGTSTDRKWHNMDGKIIIGTTLCEVIIPSPHAPRQGRT